MKNIIVISDTHGNKKAIDSIAKKLIEADYVFHLGDVAKDANYIKKEYNHNTISVLGNCDFGESEEVVQIENVKFLLTHGHKFSVKIGLNQLRDYAVKKRVNVALYGHTHECKREDFEKVSLINPGAMSSEFQPMSYCFITVVEDKFFSKIVPLNDQ